MTNTQSHAKRELELLSGDSVIKEFTPEILALVEKFGKSGQSGGSAPFVASALKNAIEKLLRFETLSPVTGEDSEWVDITVIKDGESMYQNNRDSRIFKDGKNGRAYFIDAMIEKVENYTWYGWFWKSREDYLAGNKENYISPRVYKVISFYS